MQRLYHQLNGEKTIKIKQLWAREMRSPHLRKSKLDEDDDDDGDNEEGKIGTVAADDACLTLTARF